LEAGDVHMAFVKAVGQVSPVLGESRHDRLLGACRMHNFRAGDCAGSAKIRLPLVAAG
jgi:hypothetical protein